MNASLPAVSHWLRRPFVRDYGMLFVLIALVLLFSQLTLKEQFPSGATAGLQVGTIIANTVDASAGVIIVARDTVEDREFAATATSRLQKANIDVLATVHGSAADARRAIEEVLATGRSIDAIAANEVTAKWTVYDRFEEVGADKCVTPQPYTWPDFLKLTNLVGVANQTAIYAIIAIGMTMVIITAGIDLSVGSLVALSAVVSALVIRDYGGGFDAGVGWVLLAACAGVGLCGLAGCYHGLLITTFRVPAFVVTLGMMMMARGLSRWLSNGRSIPEVPDAYRWIGGGVTLGIPNPIWLMVALYLMAHILMSRTVFGRYVYAIGGNQQAAYLSGVPVRRVMVTVYAICGGLAGLGGLVLASQLGAGDPKFGMMYELEVIAAVVVGGTSLMGGQGKIFGTLIGAFIIAVISNGMNLIGVDPDNQLIVLGAVLTGAVLLDAAKRGKLQ